MYNSIVVTNSIDCVNKKINYKFTMIFDTINWQTTVNLNVNGKEHIALFTGDMFMTVMSKIAPLMNLPFDMDGKVYEGPEIKIKLNDTYSNKIWSNMTNLNCDKSFKIPELYVSQQNQSLYDNMIAYLVKLSNSIFSKEL